MVTFGHRQIVECRSLIDEWLASRLSHLDLVKACSLENSNERNFAKKCYLELSGYALIVSRMGLKVDDRIHRFLSCEQRVSLLLALAAREPDFFSRYGMALAYAAQDSRYRPRVRKFVCEAPVFRACHPSEWAPQKLLDTAFVLHCLDIENPVAVKSYAKCILERFGGAFYFSEQHVYFLTHLIFFLNGFGCPDWPEERFKAAEALLDKALVACLGRNNLDGALEVALARAVSGQELDRLGENVLLSALAKLSAYGGIDAFVWSVPSKDFRDAFHPMIVLAILLAVLEGTKAPVALSFDELDVEGLQACAVLAGLVDAIGGHDLDKVPAAAELIDLKAVRRLLPAATRASYQEDFRDVRCFLSSGDGEGFGFYLPERLSGIDVDAIRRKELGLWFLDKEYGRVV